MANAAIHEKPGGGFELWSWLFMRLSGLLLLFLVLGHFAIVHLIHPIEELSYDFVAGRYRFFRWRLFDGAMLLLALFHGLNGVRILVDDYIRSEKWHRLAYGVLWVTGLLFGILGIVVIVFFQPA